jgi:hypothetical protein
MTRTSGGKDSPAAAVRRRASYPFRVVGSAVVVGSATGGLRRMGGSKVLLAEDSLVSLQLHHLGRELRAGRGEGEWGVNDKTIGGSNPKERSRSTHADFLTVLLGFGKLCSQFKNLWDENRSKPDKRERW